MHDEILTDLSKIRNLRVIGRMSVMNYKTGVDRNPREIGRRLGVVYLVEGSVQRAGNRVRVNAQLIDARTDAHLWAQTYDRDLANVFAIQSEIAKTIADQLHVSLSATEIAAIDQPPTSDLVAFELYTRAKALVATVNFSALGRDNLLQAVDLLDQAVARDPAFLFAWCELAAAHDRIYFLGHDPTPARLGLGDNAVQTALRLRPDTGEAHLALAHHLYQGHRDYDRARAELFIAQGTLPNDLKTLDLAGSIDRRQGRWEEAARNFERMAELDPRNLDPLQNLAITLQGLRRFQHMAAVLDRALAFAPKDEETRAWRAAVELDWRADPQPLHVTIDEILARNPSAAQSLADTWLGLALCERDMSAAARALAALPGGTYGLNVIKLNRHVIEGLLARVAGDTAGAHRAFATARVQQEEVVRARPDDAPALIVLGLIDADWTHEEALRAGRRAVVLLPVARDALNGALMVEHFAVICAWIGEKELALQHLAFSAQIPGGVSYGQLKLHPFWDPLRGDPRFEAIVASLAPK